MKQPCMPDLTPAMILGVVQAVLACLVAFGLDLSENQSIALMALAAAVAAVLGHSDGKIRTARNERLALEAQTDALFMASIPSEGEGGELVPILPAGE